MDLSSASAKPTVTLPLAPATVDSAPKISSDFDTFLRMLTAQITNQDPLNPMNSEEFAVQLATFSGVEQQVQTNELLESLGAKMGQTNLNDMASWVGLDVRANMPAKFSGQPVVVTLPAPAAGSAHQLVAYDSYGSEVWRQAADPAAKTAVWEGVYQNGVPVPPGLYSFKLESFDGDTTVATAPAEVFAQVQEVRADARGMVLVFEGGVERYSSDASALSLHKPSRAQGD